MAVQHLQGYCIRKRKEEEKCLALKFYIWIFMVRRIFFLKISSPSDAKTTTADLKEENQKREQGTKSVNLGKKY